MLRSRKARYCSGIHRAGQFSGSAEWEEEDILFLTNLERRRQSRAPDANVVSLWKSIRFLRAGRFEMRLPAGVCAAFDALSGEPILLSGEGKWWQIPVDLPAFGTQVIQIVSA